MPLQQTVLKVIVCVCSTFSLRLKVSASRGLASVTDANHHFQLTGTSRGSLHFDMRNRRSTRQETGHREMRRLERNTHLHAHTRKKKKKDTDN